MTLGNLLASLSGFVATNKDAELMEVQSVVWKGEDVYFGPLSKLEIVTYKTKGADKVNKVLELSSEDHEED